MPVKKEIVTGELSVQCDCCIHSDVRRARKAIEKWENALEDLRYEDFIELKYVIKCSYWLEDED